ncbi:MAG TPA: hypothetical protein VKA09_16695 [Nitrososphaeraceae archaeon]|nr:hypothetical protein [Nitrososphaeraceae archaeon]
MTLFTIAAGKLSKDLGYGMPVSSILSGATFSVCIFFYLYTIGSFFRITVYPLIDRVTVYATFQEYIINQHLDYIVVILATASWFLLSVKNRAIRYYFSMAYGVTGIILALISPDNIVFDIIALLSLPLIIGIMLYYYRRRQKNLLNFNAKLTWRYISLAVIAISAIGIIFPVLVVFLTPNFDSSAGDDPANELFLLLSSFSTIYIFLLALCLAVKVLQRGALRMLKLDIKQDINQNLPHDYDHHKLKTKTKIGFLLLAIILSVLLVLIPQHPLVNKDNRDIGVDTHYYFTWIVELAKSKNVSDLIYQAFVVQGQSGDRPLSLLFLFLVYQVVGGNNLREVIEHIPIILGPGIVLAFYLLTLELTRNEKIALIAAFFGAVSFHTLIGIYAGFYANWLALIVGYISIAFLFRYLRSGRLSDIVVFSTLLIGVLFVHIHTWTILAAVSGTFLVVMLLAVLWKEKKKKNGNINNLFTKRRIIWLLVAILLSTAVDITKVLLIGSSGGVERDIQVAQTNLDIEHLSMRWRVLNATMHDSLGGVFSNFIILLLGLFWVLKSNVREPRAIFLMIFLSAGIVPLSFGWWTLQVRVLYDIPFEIPAAIALYYISTRLGSRLVTLATCTWLVAISLVTVMNYYLVWRPGVH